MFPMVSRGIKDSFAIKGFRMFVDWLNDLNTWMNNNPDTNGDFTFNVTSKGPVLTSPNGTKYRITVDDLGGLHTTAL